MEDQKEETLDFPDEEVLQIDEGVLTMYFDGFQTQRDLE